MLFAGGDDAGSGIDAVAIESRERTRSRGYVAHTEVTPASAPAMSRVGVSSGVAP